MSDGRMRRKAKQGRRDTMRRNRRKRKAVDEERAAGRLVTTILSEHPLGMLGYFSQVVEDARPKRWPFEADQQTPTNLPAIIANLVGSSDVVSTAMLAALGELIDDEHLRSSCIDELANRDDALSVIVDKLADVQVLTAIRQSHVLGDFEHLYIGARVGGHEMTALVRIDHDVLSEVADASFSDGTVLEALADVKEQINEDDYITVAMDLAEARACIDHGLKQADILPVRPVGMWPHTRPLLRWLTRHLPEGGERPERPGDDDELVEEVIEQFLAAPEGAPFNHDDGRELVTDCASSGSGDPLRWSAARVQRLLGRSWLSDYGPSWERVLEVPDLLRAYIPFAHARAGIRDDLTAKTLATIDELRLDFQRSILSERAELVDADY